MEDTEKQVPEQWFVFFKDQLLLKREITEKGEVKYCVPYDTDILPVKPATGDTVHEVLLPSEVTVRTFAVEQLITETEEWMMIGLRDSYEYITPEEYKAAGKAYQILYWDQHSRFCPSCGTPTEQKEPIMKKCPSCGYEIYPHIATAIIVLIRRREEILLVRGRNFRGTFYGLVAGFLEPGETLEQCVQREVMEETGLKVKNITYFGNQPWPYPSGLMAGFIADYESGEIKLQEEEISAGAFYSKKNLPEIPRKLSIARKMIDWWIDN
ncbi:NAD(+) diphosphatase [Bacteroides sp. UBA939]|uniref:NAD(+) diphosphatase n=1 Tax=Bacteroides sp. UBA939 TaxID=1946092 RepID=UPI0025C23865|nr:NAD(+) diphosphatase [Bacteroides sp. UBA939]